MPSYSSTSRSDGLYDPQSTYPDNHATAEGDNGACGSDGGALDALWRFESSYHFLLNNELGSTYAAFVDDLYGALDHARASLEQQSARVLAVLHDKDVCIQELEDALVARPRVATSVDVGVQTKKRTTTEQSVQSELEDSGSKTMRRRIEDQEEQIEVLFDELERIQHALAEAEGAADRTQPESTVNDQEQPNTRLQSVATVPQVTQTDEVVPEKCGFAPEEVLAAIEAVQLQLKDIEKKNAELLATEIRRRHETREDPGMPLDVVERQLSDAIQKMESSMTSPCVVSTMVLPPMRENGGKRCLDLEHRLQRAMVEREELMDHVLSLRRILCEPSAAHSSPLPLRLSTSTSHDCQQVTCLHTLRSILRRVHAQQQTQTSRRAKVLRDELRHALRALRGDSVAAIASSTTQKWMDWEVSHLREMECLRKQHQDDLDFCRSRTAHLVDQVHHLSQHNVDLQAELKATKRANDSLPQTASANLNTSAVDVDRRVLALEQSLQATREQLNVAHRAIKTLSSSDDGSHMRAVRFAELEADSTQEGTPTHAYAPQTLEWKHQIARLSEELIALKSRQFKRLQPVETSEHAVVEYFRQEREALRLRNQLKQKKQQIEQLEIHREQLENAYNQLQMNNESRDVLRLMQQPSSTPPKPADHRNEMIWSSAEQLYLRFLQKQNSEMRTELLKARSRVVHLERQVANHEHGQQEDISGSIRLLRDLTARLEEHHAQALTSFTFWQASVERHHEELASNESSISIAYSVLVVHYEQLGIQLRLLHEVTASELMPAQGGESDGFADLPHRWRLLEKIHVLEDQLREAQSCKSCGKRVPSALRAEKTDASTSTEGITTSQASTQTAGSSTHDRRKGQHSKAIQVDSVQLHATEQSSLHIDTSSGVPPLDASISMAKDGTATMTMTGSSMLSDMPRELESSLARIAELAAREEKLRERLNQAQTVNKKHAKEREKLLRQVTKISSSNASLSSRLEQYELKERKGDEKRDDAVDKRAMGQEDGNENETSALAQIQQQLKLREQENAELVRQLCETKEKCYQIEKSCDDAEHKAAQLTATLEVHQMKSDQDKSEHLEAYIVKVNQSLETIERDKERLVIENQQLQQKLREIEAQMAKKTALGTRSCGTETDEDPATHVEWLLDLPEYQEMETRVVLLSNELAEERDKCKQMKISMDADKLERTNEMESQLQAVQREKAELARLTDDLKSSHESLQLEFAEYQAAQAEAKEEADKRIVFLTKCVEECARLVDSEATGNETVTSRDIYDTIVAVSKRIVAGGGRTSGPNTVKKKCAKNLPVMKLSAAEALSDRGSAAKDEQASAAVFHSQLQAEAWRVRVARLESSLRGTTLKNKTFEDMVDHLELQMDQLKDEVKDRMTKESMLLTKQGQMKAEIATIKAHSTTLLSRHAEACSELKRTQDAMKANDGELARLRSALQRKTELLTRQKIKAEETQQALDNSVKRIAQLEASEKTMATAQAKAKEQTQQLQELRQQCLVYRDANTELNDHVQKSKERQSELQSRVKALRLDNGLLRDQLGQLKKTMKKDTVVEATATSGPADSKHVTRDGLSPTSAVGMLTAQVKTLKKRVLQKQEVVVACKTKIAELDAEVTLQRTKLFEISQAYRQQHQSQQHKEQSMMQGVAHLKQELEATVSSKAEQLDGLRASIFDACEVFVQCELPATSPSSHVRESLVSSASQDGDEDDDGGRTSQGRVTDELLLELRRYADLSPGDWAHLHISDSQTELRKNKTDSRKAPYQHDLYVVERTKKRGQQLLMDLEHALEVTPHDCRTEICQVLEFLCSKSSHTLGARKY